MTRRSGMTLLEVVVALTVAGAALAAGAAVLGFLADQQERTGAPAMANAHAVRATLRDWTAAAQLTTEGDAQFRGASTRVGDEIAFVTTAPTAVARAGTHVRIFLRTAERDTSLQRGLVAELTPWRQAGPSRIVPLMREATGFQARYLGSVYGERGWQPSWVSTSVLPVAVELRVRFDTTMASPDRAAHALLALPMTIPIGGRR